MLRVKNTKTSLAETEGTVDIELADLNKEFPRRSACAPSIMCDELTSKKPYDKITLLNTLKNIILFRKPGYTPSPAALKDFQDEMERRLKQKSSSGGGNGIGRSANCYKVISIHPSSIPEDISFDRMMVGATFPVSLPPRVEHQSNFSAASCEQVLTYAAYQHERLQSFLDQH